MGENLIVWVEGKYPLSSQGKNKWGYCLMNVINAKPQNVWAHWLAINSCLHASSKIREISNHFLIS